jgi:hypothetical protein
VDLVPALGRTIPFAFTSGINLYATVAILGLCSRFQLIALPPEFQAFAHPVVITSALALYTIEFIADKVPWLDSIWDAVHTVIRPIGGALVAITALGDPSPGMQALVGVLGGSVAALSHLTKAGTRAAANTSPEPFSNVILSLVEDVFVATFVYAAIRHPLIALTITIVLLGIIVAFAAALIRGIRGRFQGQSVRRLRRSG